MPATFHRIALAAIILLAALTGCATTPKPHSADKIKFVSVERVVTANCVKPDQIPAMPEKVGGQLTGYAPIDVDLLAVSALHLRAALGQALALLSGCAIPEQ